MENNQNDEESAGHIKDQKDVNSHIQSTNDPDLRVL
jgi:hypothetical protein